MAIHVRLIFDVEDSTLDDDNLVAASIASQAADAVIKAIPGATLVGVNRLTIGLMQGNATVEAVEGQTWARVEIRFHTRSRTSGEARQRR